MRRGRKTTAAASAGLVGRRLRRVVALALVLMAAGCVPEPAFDNDPLVGGPPLPRNGSPPPRRLATGRGVRPRGRAAATAAALRLRQPGRAGHRKFPGRGRQRAPPRPAADQPRPGAGALTSAPSAGGDGWHGTAASPGALLKGPEPITDGTVKPIAVIAPPLAGPAPPPPSPAPPPPPVQGFSPAPAARPFRIPTDSCRTNWRNGGALPAADGAGRARAMAVPLRRAAGERPTGRTSLRVRRRRRRRIGRHAHGD